MKLFKYLSIGLVLSSSLNVQALVIDPDTYTAETGLNMWTSPDHQTVVNSLPDLNTVFGTSFTGLEEVYLAETDFFNEEGLYADRLDFSIDYAARTATVSYSGTGNVGCPLCLLIVKDGNSDPAQYMFDLGSWDGSDDIVLTNLWDHGWEVGSGTGWNTVFPETPISHIRLWSNESMTVPEPSLLALMGAGLVGLGFARRRPREQ